MIIAPFKVVLDANVQRPSISNVVQLFGPRKSGEGSGGGAPSSGRVSKKAQGD